ncbi:hypothetical protein DFH29DRAFT_1000778 [Suillus ampliporus]|nr:hypothetical protein DFH29DRAFT_1000778 [Suillus ampliporus]
MSVTCSDHPAIHPQRTWFAASSVATASWRARSKNPSGNVTNGSFFARTCYMLHGMLVMIHIFLVISYISHWEHRVTLPFTPTNDDFWPVVLSASLQASYTIYTAALLFLTQRLAVSRTLVRRLKLTAIHDISGAWAGLGSALSSVWQQIHIPASWRMTSAVTAYLACISVLHVTSSTLLQFQTFNASMTTSVPTTLGWLDLSVPASDPKSGINWGAMIASLPVVNQLPGLVSTGLSSATVYDIPQTNSIVGYATVNATTITSHCGLLPNISYSVNPDASTIQANSSIGNGNFLILSAQYPWSDQIRMIEPLISTISGALFAIAHAGYPVRFRLYGLYIVRHRTFSTRGACYTDNLGIFKDPAASTADPTSYVVEAYFVQCSLSAVTAEAMLDMQTNSLRNPVSVSQPSTQWGINQWTSNTWQSVIGGVLANPALGSGYSFVNMVPHASTMSSPSIADEYIMSLVGLNLTAEFLQSTSSDAPVSTVVLSPDKLEAAIAQVAARLVWMAGRLGPSNGGVQPGNGMAYVDGEIISLRLNINLLPLSFAISASVIMLGLALYTTRAFDSSHDIEAAIPNTGALQLLWLGRRSATVNEVLEDVEHPTEANLRRAGMIDVCFAKTILSDEKESGSSSDSLSSQVDNGRDDEM